MDSWGRHWEVSSSDMDTLKSMGVVSSDLKHSGVGSDSDSFAGSGDSGALRSGRSKFVNCSAVSL